MDQLKPEIKNVVKTTEKEIKVKYPKDPLVAVDEPLVQDGNNGVVKIVQNFQNPTKKETTTITKIFNPSTGVQVTEDISIRPQVT